jgi:hypothetical protein
MNVIVPPTDADADHRRLRTTWEEFEHSWDRTYPKGLGPAQWVWKQTWIDCSEKAAQLAIYMAELR